MLRSRCWVAAVFLLGTTGCGPAWRYAYDEGLRQARREDRDLLVFYKDSLDVRSSRMRDVLETSAVQRLMLPMVRCVLVPSYAPNRAFMAQYGIQETPAIVVVHPDGTYHALAGVRPAQEVGSFLESARAPGKEPDLNPRIPQGQAFAYFNIYERAVEKARRQNRRLVIIYKWWLDPDGTELIRRVSRPDVARYFADSVNCIMDWDHIPNRSHVRKYGVTSFPAIIIVEPDGTFRSLTGVPSVDRIIRLAMSSRLSGEPAAANRGPDDKPPVVWFTDYDAASLAAQHTGRDLLVFFHSKVSAVSSAVAGLLDQPGLRPLLASVVNCRLDWSQRSNRERLARFGVKSVPACVLVRPDGSFEVLSGQVTADGLRAFLKGVGPDVPSQRVGAPGE